MSIDGWMNTKHNYSQYKDDDHSEHDFQVKLILVVAQHFAEQLGVLDVHWQLYVHSFRPIKNAYRNSKKAFCSNPIYSLIQLRKHHVDIGESHQANGEYAA